MHALLKPLCVYVQNKFIFEENRLLEIKEGAK